MKVKVGMAAAAATIALLAPAVAHAGNWTQGTAGSVRIDVTTSHGTANATDPTITNHLVKLIQDASAGSSIHTNVYRVETDDPVFAALKDAKVRGVNVFVIYDGGGDTSPPDAFNWVTPGRLQVCDAGCHNEPATGADGKAHSKYFLFDKTRRRRKSDDALETPPNGQTTEHAVWIGSANLNKGSGSRASNMATTFFSDKTMYDGMKYVWQAAFDQNPADGDYYMGEQDWQPWFGVVFSPSAGSVAHMSPETNGPDLWVRQLERQPAHVGCTVRVMQALITDERLAAVDQLVRLGSGGCQIRVMVDDAWDHDNNPATPAIPGIGSEAKRRLCNTPNTQLKIRHRLHDKGVSTLGNYEFSSDTRRQVFSGSHNWTGNAQNKNDEVLLRVADSQTAYDAFYEHFSVLWGSPSGLTRVLTCP